jgi:hypothetical protein
LAVVVAGIVAAVVVVAAGGSAGGRGAWAAASAYPIWISLPAGRPPWSTFTWTTSAVTYPWWPFVPSGAVVSVLSAYVVT